MIHLEDLVVATGASVREPVASREFTDFCFDSRLVQAGQLFVAVVTDTGDGHDYVSAACRAGAVGVLCQQVPHDAQLGATYVVVDDTQLALLDYARHILHKYALDVVAVGGSVGKTSTKEAIASVLGQSYSVFRNRGNYNGRFGLPVSLGQLAGTETVAVLELAADSHDEIRQLADLCRPRIGVLTSIGHHHMDVFGSLEQIAQEEGRLIEALPPQGLAILNGDDPLVSAMAARAPCPVVTYGLGEEADLRAENVRVSALGTDLVCRHGLDRIPLHVPFVGPHHAYTALAAAAVGLAKGLEWSAIQTGLAELIPLPGRTRLIEGRQGIGLLDDSYDATPESAASGLRSLAMLPARRRWAVLSDMTHLGDFALAAHRQLGTLAAEAADALVTKGELAHLTAEAAAQAGMPANAIHVAYADDDIVRLITERCQAGDLVLLKGASEARLERVAGALLAQPQLATTLLARQNHGWQQVRLQRPGRPTWVEIDLGAIAHNIRRTIEIVGPQVGVLAVLKADAYGHGAIKVARTALNNGVQWIGVACLGEAITLREAGIDAPILNLGFTPPWQARAAVLHNVVSTVFSLDVARALSRAAGDMDRRALLHLKIDTGMGRLGMLPDEALGLLNQIAELPGIEIDGVFTHFSASDDPDLSYTQLQLGRFQKLLDQVRHAGFAPRWVHAANSAALLRLPASRFNLVRLGIAMYGLNASDQAPCPPDFEPALQFKCQVAQVKALPAGSCVGYGRTYQTTRPSRIAVIPVGYADGFRRGPRHWGEVLVRGERAPIVGRVCMDQTMLDVTDILGVRAGDEVVLIGAQGRDRISVEQVAERLGTINYEVISEILARVPRLV